MNYDQCKNSNTPLPLSTGHLLLCSYVECPECGSIGKATDANEYHRHNTLMGTARTRDQWWKFNKNSREWILVKREEVK